jgi:hypothetical protein
MQATMAAVEHSRRGPMLRYAIPDDLGLPKTSLQLLHLGLQGAAPVGTDR